jgi:hypothetical protein
MKVCGEKEDSVRARDTFFSVEKETKIINCERNVLYTTKEHQQLKRIKFIGDSISYIALRDRWCNIIVLNVFAPSEERSDDSKDRFYEKLGLCEFK